MKPPSITILVPIYNVEKYLRMCLDSIVSQTFRDLEIILINDGSTDGSKSIIDEYSEKDPRIIIIDKANSGYGSSMNIGLSKASGKYIGIVEPDDWIEPDMFESLYEESERNKLDVCRSEFFFHSEKKGDVRTRTEDVPHDQVIRPADHGSVFFQKPSIWANLYLRSFLIDNGIRFL